MGPKVIVEKENETLIYAGTRLLWAIAFFAVLLFGLGHCLAGMVAYWRGDIPKSTNQLLLGLVFLFLFKMREWYDEKEERKEKGDE